MKVLATFAVVVLPLFIVRSQICNCETINDTKYLHDRLLQDYNRDVRPVIDQTTKVYVNMSADLLAVTSLDDVTGIFSFFVMFTFGWRDESLVWDPDLYNGTTEVYISQNKVWVPELILVSAADGVRFIGRNGAYKVTYQQSGHGSYWLFERIESSCVVNVRKYPFDVQDCYVVFSTFGIRPEHLGLVIERDKMSMKYFVPNSVWEVQSTRMYLSNHSLMIFNFKLRRKSEILVLNVLLPITLLGLLNVLVFLLVPESGDRISYCITVLLAISVFMTIVSDTLPKSSDPVPMISYKLMIDEIISMLIAFVTILNVRIYNKGEEKQVPAILKRIYWKVFCMSCKQPGTVFEAEHDDAATSDPPSKKKPFTTETGLQRCPKVSDNKPTRDKMDLNLTTECSPRVDEHVTWKNIATLIDLLAFICFMLTIIASCVWFVAYAKHVE